MDSTRNGRRAQQRGFVLLQAAILLAVMGSFASLAVDVGIFHTAKAELQCAADSAALAAAAVIHDGGTTFAATQEAYAYAEANPVSGEKLTASAIDVTYGGYANGQFVPGGTPVQAVKVQLKRTTANGNPVRLYCSQLIGLYSVDAYATSVVKIRQATPPYNLVGIDSASFGSIGVLAKIDGRIVSNGNVSIGYPLGLLVGVQGEARSWGGITRKGTLAGISGSVAKLQDQLQYPSVTLPAANNNAQIATYLNGSGDLTVLVSAVIPSGVYVVRDLNILAGIAVRLDGPVTFYVTRNFNLGAAVNLLGNTNFSPSNFKVRIAPGGSVNFLAPVLVPLNLDLYAPDSPIFIGVGISAFKGRLIGKTLDIALPVIGSFTEDQSLLDAIEDLPNLAIAHL